MATSTRPDGPAAPTPPADVTPGGAARHARWTWLLGGVLLVVLAAPRLGLRELWLDESFSLAATRDLPGTWKGSGGTMALYYLLLTPWSWVSEHPAWLRTLSLVLMAAAVAVFGATIRRQHGPRVAAWATAFAGASYLVVTYAVEARSYALVALLTATSWYALDRSIEEGGGRWRAVHLAVAVALPLAHGVAGAQLAAQLVAVLAARAGRAAVRQVVLACGAAVAVVAGLATVGLSDVGDWMDPLTPELVWLRVRAVTSPEPLLAVLLAGLAAAGGWLLLGHAPRTAAGATRPGPSGAGRPVEPVLVRFRRWTPLMWGPGALAVVLAASLVRPVHLSRYSLAAVFGMAALWAVAVDHAARAVPRGWIAGVAALAVLGFGLPPYAEGRTPWRDAAALVSAGGEDGHGLAFGSPDRRIAFEVAWREVPSPPAIDLVADGAPLGSYDRFADDAEPAELAQALLGYGTVWLVDSLPDEAASRTDELLDHRAVRRRFRVAHRWDLGDDVHVWRLEAR